MMNKNKSIKHFVYMKACLLMTDNDLNHRILKEQKEYQFNLK
jgi:hypothetical protein